MPWFWRLLYIKRGVMCDGIRIVRLIAISSTSFVFFSGLVIGTVPHQEQIMKIKRMSFSAKISRLWARLHDAEWRRYGKLLLAGKLIGIGLLLFVVYVINPGMFGSSVLAADGDLKATDVVNPLNTVWVLVAAFLVFGMQVGFTML